VRSIVKSAERGFRRFLLGFLRIVARPRTSPSPRPDVRTSKVLFIRQDRIGDVLVSTPLFSCLKRRHPGITLDVLLSTNNHAVLDHSHVIRKRWIYRKLFWPSVKTLGAIRREQYDYVVDLMDNPSATSTVILLLSGGKRTVGLQKDNAYACDIVVPLKSRRESHIVDRLAQLLTVFDIDPAGEDLKIEYECSRESDAAVRNALVSSGNGGASLIGINISAGSEARFWGVENYRKLVRHLRATLPEFSVLMLSKPDDRERVLAILADVQNAIIPPKTNFDEFAAWIKNCALLITPDTSAVHLAAAFKVPSVVLYVQSDPALRIWEPYRVPSESLITPHDDLKTIPAEDVCAAVTRLVEREVRTKARRSVTP
jgi:ADP-heptose:LPS heptosyltransferase